MYDTLRSVLWSDQLTHPQPGVAQGEDNRQVPQLGRATAVGLPGQDAPHPLLYRRQSTPAPHPGRAQQTGALAWAVIAAASGAVMGLVLRRNRAAQQAASASDEETVPTSGFLAG
jgi:hypothetical protein